MKRFALALAFTCVLSATAVAGEIPSTGITSPPPPPPPGATAQTDLPGEILSTGVTSPGEMPTCGLSVLLTALGLVF
jgi:hypothetical protein